MVSLRKIFGGGRKFSATFVSLLSQNDESRASVSVTYTPSESVGLIFYFLGVRAGSLITSAG